MYSFDKANGMDGLRMMDTTQGPNNQASKVLSLFDSEDRCNEEIYCKTRETYQNCVYSELAGII